ncbi:MAG: hypothetical protein ACYDDN_11405 [Candidatus Desulforudaceae bacterium]
MPVPRPPAGLQRGQVRPPWVPSLAALLALIQPSELVPGCASAGRHTADPADAAEPDPPVPVHTG